MALKFKIIDKREVPTMDPARLGEMDVVVSYLVEPDVTMVVTIPKKEVSEATLRERVKAAIEEREKWIGKEIEI